MTKFQELLQECISQVQDDAVEAMIACWSRPRLNFVDRRLVLHIGGLKAQKTTPGFAGCRPGRPARLGSKYGHGFSSALAAGRAV